MEGLTVETTCLRCGKPIEESLRAGGEFCPTCSFSSRRRGIRFADVPRLGDRRDKAIAGTEPSRLTAPPAAVRRGGRLLEGLVPWAISILAHVGAALLAMTTIVVVRGAPARVVVPIEIVAAEPGAQLKSTPLYAESGGPAAGGSSAGVPQAVHDPLDSALRGQGDANGAAAGFAGISSSGGADLIGIGPAATGLVTGSAGTDGASGPRSSFFGTGAVAQHVVYVIDRSGSMLDTFDDVCRQVLTSVGRLAPSQDFHIILFADDAAIEMPSGGLVPPRRENKLAAAEFLQSARPGRRSDPIPALHRAFDVLDSAGGGSGKVVYFLTDGLLPNSASVLETIAHRNRNGQVHINTYLFGGKDEAAAAVMRRIAEHNGGAFKQLNPERPELADSGAGLRTAKEQ
jgi:hypothetical protein